MSAKKIFRSFIRLVDALKMDTGFKKGKKAFRIAVEGNIGCGKTSFLNFFANEFKDKVKVFTEPVNKWRDVGGHNLLDLMYRDPKKWSFAFQQYVQLTMFELHSEMTNYNDDNVLLKMCERSLMSARHCFVENLHQCGLMTRVEYNIIDEWYKHMMKDKSTKLDCIIYLRTSPEVCLQRIAKRGRQEEQHIDLAYLRTLHNLHEKWLGSIKRPVIVIPLNANVSLPEMRYSYEKCSEIIFKENFEHPISFEQCL